jgi:phosphoketolase
MLMACCFTVEDVRAQHRRTLVSLGRYRRLSDFISSSLAFLARNSLLRAVLSTDDLRARPAGPWHGVPAMGVLYAHLNRLHRDHPEDMRFITSVPGAPLAHLANLWIEGGTCLEYGAAGGGLSALAADVAGALARPLALDHPTADEAFARALSALDEGSGTVVCAVEVDRAQRQFLDGAVGLMRTARSALLPILVVGGRLGATPGYGSMDEAERTAWLEEMGYAVRVVETGLQFEARLYTALEWAWHAARGEVETSGHPVIVLGVPRSLTMPPTLSTLLDRRPLDFLDDIREDESRFDVFRGWIEGYQADELIEADGQPDGDILALCAPPEARLGRNRGRTP